MEPTEDFRIAQHNSLQELAYHFDSINWNMHTIFVPLHVALVGWLVISMVPPTGSLWKDLPGAVIGVSASCAGLWLTNAWRYMYERHRLFITTAYRRLRAIETSLRNGRGPYARFDVHTLMGIAIKERRESRRDDGKVATSYVIKQIHGVLMASYMVIGLVALARVVIMLQF